MENLLDNPSNKAGSQIKDSQGTWGRRIAYCELGYRRRSSCREFDAEALIRAMDALMDNGEVVEDALAR